MGYFSRRRLRDRSIMLAVAVFCSVSLLASYCRAQQRLPDKSTVISAVRENVSSIQSIHAQFNFWQQGKLIAKSLGVSPDTEVGPVLTEWAEQGRQKLMRTSGAASEPRGMRTTFDSYDGEFAYQVSYEPEDASKIRHIRRMAEHRFDILTRAVPSEMCGLRVPTQKGTLADLLSLESATIVGEEELFSSRCLHVRVPDVGTPGAVQQTAIDVWLDLEHEYLPRRFTAAIRNDSPRVAPQNQRYEYLVEAPELMSVRDELLGRMRWFPRIVLGSSKFGKTRAVVESAALNRKLPKSLFQPLMPVGTVIIEGEDKPFVAPVTSIVGGNGAANALIEQRLREAKNLPAPPAVPTNSPAGYVDANAAVGWDWRMLVGAVCVCVLAIVCVRNLWFRS